MTDTEARFILGLPSAFSSRDLKRGYRRAAAANHPDRGGSTERMVLVNAAFEALSGGPAFTAAHVPPEPQPPPSPTVNAAFREYFGLRNDRRSHPFEPYVVHVSAVLAVVAWIAGLIESIKDYSTLRGWIVLGLPFSYLMISVLLRFAVRCGIHVYNFGVKLRDRVGPVGVRQ